MHCPNLSTMITQMGLGLRYVLGGRSRISIIPSILKRNSSSDIWEVSEIDGVRILTMSDTATRNSLTKEMSKNLLKGLTDNVSNKSLRAIVITSSVPGIFSAGHNLKEIATSDGRQVFDIFANAMSAIKYCPVPVIATVDGVAAAAGLQLVAASDIVLCTSDSSFVTPGAKFGVFCSTPGIPLARNVPKKVAAYMVLTGLPITADEALQAGLVSKVASNRDELSMKLEEICTAIKSLSRSVIENGKNFFNEQIEMDLSSAYEKGTDEMKESLTREDGKEGLKSFMEKRKPKWRHSSYV